MLNTNQLVICLAIVLYLVFLLVIGFACARRNEDAQDFYLGGRKLGPIVTAMSAEASDMSSWLLMGIPGMTFFCGIADTFWTCFGLIIGTYVNWLIVAQRLRHYSERIGAITIPDFFARRFHDKGNLLIGISALVIIVFFIPYTASGFAACGKLFSSMFGIEYMTGMFIGALVIVGYTALGGFWAASMTDLIQSIIMTLALIIIIGFGIEIAGGLSAIKSAAQSVNGYISLNNTANILTGETSEYGGLTIASTMAWGLGYFGMPHILLRFMAMRHREKVGLSRRIATIWVIIAMGCAIFIGVIGYAMSKVGAVPLFQSSSSAEALLIHISNLLSTYGIVPAILAGLVLAGILACTMSTADSQLLAAASSVSENLLKSVFGIQLSSKNTIRVARIAVLTISIIGIFIARDPNSSVFQIVSFAWAGFGAAFGPVMLFSLFWKRCNKWGALAGMISGGITVFVWKYLIHPLGGIWGIYELLPAFIVACIAIILVSLTTESPSKEIEDEFSAVH